MLLRTSGLSQKLRNTIAKKADFMKCTLAAILKKQYPTDIGMFRNQQSTESRLG